jgi:MraZ protein
MAIVANQPEPKAPAIGTESMALFLSTFEKQIDKKGRVSVPPALRAVLQQQNFNGVIVYGSFVHPCIEACGIDRIEALHQRIEALDPFSQERDAFATAILGGAVQLPFDGEGRVVLPENLLEQAGITTSGVFVGKGATFEIWAPEQFALHQASARELAKQQRLVLKSAGPQ